MADNGELVESGTFRVDRKKALEKLKEFQLPDPTMFLLPWVRCAVASGATEIAIQLDQQKTRLEVRFDGRPFVANELRDPYGCLLDESTPENTRNRHLAIGILASLNLSPQVVTVTSGAGSESISLLVESLEKETVEASAGAYSGETVLGVVCSSASDMLKLAVKHVETNYLSEAGPRVTLISLSDGCCVALGGKRPAARAKQQAAGVSFSKGSVRGWVKLPEHPDEVEGVLKLYHYNVLVESIQDGSFMVPVAGAVNNNKFRLNVSQSGVARDDQFNATIRIVAAHAERLLLHVCQKQGKLIKAVRDRLRARSGGRNEGGHGLFTLAEKLLEEKGEEQSLSASEERQLGEAARATAWLRRACTRLLHDLDKDSARPTLRALWTTPIFLGVHGTPLTLAQLEHQRRKRGHVMYTTQRNWEGKWGDNIVWCVSDQDYDDLAKFFPGRMKNVRWEGLSFPDRAGEA